MLNSIPGLYPLEATSSTPLVMTNENVSDIVHCSLMGQKHPLRSIALRYSSTGSPPKPPHPEAVEAPLSSQSLLPLREEGGSCSQ